MGEKRGVESSKVEGFVGEVEIVCGEEVEKERRRAENQRRCCGWLLLGSHHVALVVLTRGQQLQCWPSLRRLLFCFFSSIQEIPFGGEEARFLSVTKHTTLKQSRWGGVKAEWGDFQKVIYNNLASVVVI